MNDSSNSFGGIIAFLILGALVAAIVAFFRGPAKRSEQYINELAAAISDPNDRALLFSLYRQKGGKSVLTAWLLTVFLSPTIAYIYLGEVTKALLAFFTAQGFGLWWIISWFTMPMEALGKNKKAADEALTQLRLARPYTPVREMVPSESQLTGRSLP